MSEVDIEHIDFPGELKGRPVQKQIYAALVEAGEEMKRAEIAQMTDLDPDSVSQALRGLRSDNLAEKVGHGLYTLSSREDTEVTPSGGFPTSRKKTEDIPSFFGEDVQLDVYTDIKVQGGDGRVVYPDEARRQITIPRDFIRKIIGFMPPREVGMMICEGDSMHPTIQEDDMVLFRFLEGQIQGGGVYVLRIDDSLSVKRVQKIPGGGLELISDNDYHGYPNYTLVPQDGHLVNERTGRTVDLEPQGKVIFPRRETDRMHVKQVAAIIKSVVGGDGAPESLGR